MATHVDLGAAHENQDAIAVAVEGTDILRGIGGRIGCREFVL